MNRPQPSVCVLAALIAVLLPAGVFAATTTDGGTPAAPANRTVGAAGYRGEAVAEEAAVPPAPAPVAVTSTVAPPPVTVPPLPSTLPRTPAPTAARPPTSVSPTTVTTRPTGSTSVIPPPPFPVYPPRIPAGSSWSARADGVSVRMRMEPAAPVAGQPVTFYVDDLITQDPCCGVALMFGDSQTFFPLTGGGSCGSPTSLTGLSITHTYAAPGAYEAVLATATFPCRPLTSVAPGEPVPRHISGVGLHACIIVGPGDAGAAGCP